MRTLACLAALIAPTAVFASEVDTDRIQARLDTATRLFESNLHADALQVLDEVAAGLGADGEAQFPLLRFMMARCLVELDRPEDALAALDRFKALARNDEERALAEQWAGKVRARAFGAVDVQCPEGATARLEGENVPEPAPCPATFESVRAGSYAVRVDGPDGPLLGDVEVTGGGSASVTPMPPPPAEPWLWGGLGVAGGTGLMGGGVPDGIDGGAGGHVQVEALGEVALFDGLRLRLGAGFAHTRLAFDDTALDLAGTWTRNGILVPLDVRVELPWSLAVTVGGGLDICLGGEEIRDDATTTLDTDESFTDLGGFARLGLERPIYADGLEIRLALRFQRWLTPVFRDADPVAQTLDLGIIALL